MPLLDELCPAFVGARSLLLQVTDLAPARAFSPVQLSVAIDPIAVEAASAGLIPPIELTITAPSRSGFFRHVYRRAAPRLITFTPREGGEHLVRLREVGHNLVWGALVVSVAGERADPRSL
jgi:hypothetical protein